MKSIGLLWAQYGPYHFARASALKEHAAPVKVHLLELASHTSAYGWDRSASDLDLISLFPGSVAETLSFREVFRRARRVFGELKLEVCFLPSYAPKQSLAALLAAKSLGIRTVMMNESHAGTARATGLTVLIKRQLVGLFDSALVGGNPQQKYIAALGLPADRILTGYDAIDNDYFTIWADHGREQSAVLRCQYDLPEHYFLSLGRFVAKKNLSTLIRAYSSFVKLSRDSRTHLVMVGSGEEEAGLRSLCQELRLPIYDKKSAGTGQPSAAGSHPVPGVHFYGFRQIEENPVFYALADAFILPSLWEEWGLVVNEAMASSLPVLVSETAGCADDLLESGELHRLPDDESERVNAPGLKGRIRRSGLVFDPKSADELARAMWLLDSCPHLRQRMGQAAREIVEKFSCHNFAVNAMHAALTALGQPSPKPQTVPAGYNG